MAGPGPASALVVGALLLVQVLFGINYVVSKIVVGAVPPLLWASFRIILCAAIMMAVARAAGGRPPRGRAFFVPLIAFALLGMIVNQATFLTGLRLTTATNSAVLNTLIPIFTLLIVTLRGQEPLTWKGVLGFLSAFAGVLVLRRVEDLTLSNVTVIGDLLTIVNCLSYAIFLSYSKPFLERHDRLWTTAWMFVYGSIGLTVLASPEWIGLRSLPTFTPTLIACMVFGIVGGTLLTYFLNNWALSHTRASSVALFIYLQPMVAMVIAWLWTSEPITLRSVGSSLLIFVGVILGVSGRSRAAAPAAEAAAVMSPGTIPSAHAVPAADHRARSRPS